MKNHYDTRARVNTYVCTKCGLEKEVSGRGWPDRAALRCMKCKDFTVHEKKSERSGKVGTNGERE